MHIIRRVVLRIRAQILFLPLLQVHRILLLFSALLILNLHFVQLIHALRRIFYFIEKAHLLQAITLVRPIHHAQLTLWLEDHSPLLGTAHLVWCVLCLWGIIHVANLRWHLLSILGITKLRNNHIWINVVLLSHFEQLLIYTMVLLRVINQFALGSILRPYQHIVF